MTGYVSVPTVNVGDAADPIAQWAPMQQAVLWLGENRPRVRCYRSTNQTLTTGVSTAVTFDQERYDVDNCHSTASNTSRITIPTDAPGLWMLGWTIPFAANVTGERVTDLVLNGTAHTIDGDDKNAVTGSRVTRCKGTSMFRAVAGDRFEVFALQTSGGNLDIVSNSLYSPEFWAVWIAP